MFLTTIFLLSGIVLMALVVAKRVEEKRGSTVFILRAISNGDEYFHELNLRVLHYYTIGKERVAFFITKQLPLRTKSLLNKFITWTQELSAKYLGDIRNARLLKKNDGLSEFFKSISEIEKGGGEINESLHEELSGVSPTTYSTAIVEEIVAEKMETTKPVYEKPKFEQAQTVVMREPKHKAPKKKREVKSAPAVSPMSSSPILKSRRSPIPQKKKRVVKVLSQSVENVNW